MAAQRRPRGSLRDAKKVAFTLEEASDDAATNLAAHLGVTKSALVQWLIDNVQKDDRGFPVGWPDTSLRDGELPIDSA
jgi:hypothetical protein